MGNSATEPHDGLFETEHSTRIVDARVAPSTDPRLREVMSIVVRHLHAAVKEAAITEAELMKAIAFLTATGQICDDWRQEFILLSDVLGVSMLVDAVSHDRPGAATQNTVLGPFYVAGAPTCENGANIALEEKGEPLIVRGRVVDTAGNLLPGATIDTWQTNDDGFYDVQQKGIQPEWNLRGVFTADERGEYWFRTVKPRFYPIPDDGPVGALLAALGRHPYRPAHIHFIVRAAGFNTITTHIFPPDCPYLREDPVFGVKQSLIADFRRVDAPEQMRALGLVSPGWQVDWDFVMTPE